MHTYTKHTHTHTHEVTRPSHCNYLKGEDMPQRKSQRHNNDDERFYVLFLLIGAHSPIKIKEIYSRASLQNDTRQHTHTQYIYLFIEDL